MPSAICSSSVCGPAEVALRECVRRLGTPCNPRNCVNRPHRRRVQAADQPLVGRVLASWCFSMSAALCREELQFAELARLEPAGLSKRRGSC